MLWRYKSKLWLNVQESYFCSPSAHLQPLSYLLSIRLTQFTSAQLQSLLDEENMCNCLHSLIISSRLKGAKTFLTSLPFYEQLEFPFDADISSGNHPHECVSLICICQLKSTRHERQAYSLITQRFQSTNALSWLSGNSSKPIRQSVLSSNCTKGSQERKENTFVVNNQ